MADLDSVSLRDYLERMIRGVEQNATMRAEHIESTISTAHEEMNRRLEGMNEIREAMSDQAATFASREALSALDARVQDLRIQGGDIHGRRVGAAPWSNALVMSALMVGAALCGAIVALIFDVIQGKAMP